MNGLDFLDTNILVYAYSRQDAAKQQIAQRIVARALLGEFTASVQVIAEFASVLLHKSQPQLSAREVSLALEAIRPIRVISPDVEIVRRAVEAHANYGIHFYDGMIVAAAERAGSKRIWSEDLNAGQTYFGVKVANPFARS
jgi:predicted nucleic acid-binding protein